MVSSSPTPSLLGLPTELRIEILRYLLPNKRVISYVRRGSKIRPAEEAIAAYQKQNKYAGDVWWLADRDVHGQLRADRREGAGSAETLLERRIRSLAKPGVASGKNYKDIALSDMIGSRVVLLSFVSIVCCAKRVSFVLYGTRTFNMKSEGGNMTSCDRGCPMASLDELASLSFLAHPRSVCVTLFLPAHCDYPYTAMQCSKLKCCRLATDWMHEIAIVLSKCTKLRELHIELKVYSRVSDTPLFEQVRAKVGKFRISYTNHPASNILFEAGVGEALRSFAMLRGLTSVDFSVDLIGHSMSSLQCF